MNNQFEQKSLTIRIDNIPSGLKATVIKGNKRGQCFTKLNISDKDKFYQMVESHFGCRCFLS